MRKLWLIMAAFAVALPMQALAGDDSSRFEKMDANGDGSVTQQEFMSYHEEKAMKKFNEMDKNGDHVISSDETGNKGRKEKKKKGKDNGDNDD